MVEVGLEIGVDEHISGHEQAPPFVASLHEPAAKHQLDIPGSVAMAWQYGSAISLTADRDVAEGHRLLDGSWSSELVSRAQGRGRRARLPQPERSSRTRVSLAAALAGRLFDFATRCNTELAFCGGAAAMM